jgi:hypothetical protein
MPMTFALVRAGLPNTIVALALAATPLVAFALNAGEPLRPTDLAAVAPIVSHADTVQGGADALE